MSSTVISSLGIRGKIRMLTDWEKTVLSDIKGTVASALSMYTIPFTEDEMYLLYDLYTFIDKTTCTVGAKKKTSVDYLSDDKDTFMQQMIDYAVELEKSKIKEIKDVIKKIGKLIEGDEPKKES